MSDQFNVRLDTTLAGKKLFQLQVWGVNEDRPAEGKGEFATHDTILLDHIRGMAARSGCEVQMTTGSRGVIFRGFTTVAHFQVSLVGVNAEVDA